MVSALVGMQTVTLQVGIKESRVTILLDAKNLNTMELALNLVDLDAQQIRARL
jgi:hypothetical protein